MYLELAVNKTRIGLPGSDRTPDRIGSDYGSNWCLCFWCRRIILTKAAVTMTQVARNSKAEFSRREPNRFDSDFFFRAACVTNTKEIVSHASPGLQFTISFKIIAKNYFQLNCTGKFAVA